MRSLTYFVLALAGAAAAGNAQPVSERVEGLYRICAYPGPVGFTSDAARGRQHRVPIGQNCPAFPPDAPRTPPPTAMLVDSDVSEGFRQCVYEHSGTQWTQRISLGRYCPLAAGMLPRDSSAGR